MDKSLEASVSLESDIRALKESIIQEQLKSLRKKNLQCDLCQYKATRKDSLRKHLQNHTNLKVTQKQSREQNKEKERKLNCDNCEKTFTTSASLRKHKTWHTDYPKPFKCNTCGYATHAERILRNHIQYKFYVSVLFVQFLNVLFFRAISNDSQGDIIRS